MLKILLFTFFITTFVTLTTIQITRAFFTDQATSSSNTFTAAASFSTNTPSVTPTPTPTPTGTESNLANHIVISEVQIAGTTSAAQDFIELYNPTGTALNLNGYRIIRRANGSSIDDSIKAFDGTDIIPEHGYYLWANSDNGFSSSINADAGTSENITDNNTLALRNGALNTGIIIDAVGWGTPTGGVLTSTFFTSNPVSGQSIERKAYSTSTISSMTSGADVSKGNGEDSNNNSIDFILRAVSQPQNSSSAIETP